MNNESIGLIIFAFTALAAVFAFILVLGGPEPTAKVSGTQKLGTSTFNFRDAAEACSKGTNCEDGLPGIPTGRYDELREVYECHCQTSDPSFTFYRARWQ
ncbi:hypothetical protein HY489_03605 [Candidatus Woesearchaeota archaeon]|nr:hypothetical protein [Candidatus Woesearchaeota archaeon]